jgi:hypothetical protein
MVHKPYGPGVLDDLDVSGVWCAHLELRLKSSAPDYANGFRGGFTTVFVRCETAAEFVIAASEHVAAQGFEIAGIQELYQLAYGQLELDADVEELIEQTYEYPVQCTEFHIFKGDA